MQRSSEVSRPSYKNLVLDELLIPEIVVPETETKALTRIYGDHFSLPTGVRFAIHEPDPGSEMSKWRLPRCNTIVIEARKRAAVSVWKTYSKFFDVRELASDLLRVDVRDFDIRLVEEMLHRESTALMSLEHFFLSFNKARETHPHCFSSARFTRAMSLVELGTRPALKCIDRNTDGATFSKFEARWSCTNDAVAETYGQLIFTVARPDIKSAVSV